MPRSLGRNPFRPDDRDWSVERVKALIASGAAVPLQWTPSIILDQGDEGTCVAAGTLGACDCDDENHVISTFTNADIDPFFDTIPGHDPRPDGGAEVRDGLKAAKAAGYISSYALLTGSAQIKDWQEKHGPVVFGADWMSSMDSPDAKGFVKCSGYVRGGHCFYGNGDVGGQDFVNSWGDSWADHGHFYMTASDFAKLQNGDFEAWAVVQPAPAPVPTPVPTPTPTPTPDPSLWQSILDALHALEAAIEKFLAG
jgi:hypothetical protein